MPRKARKSKTSKAQIEKVTPDILTAFSEGETQVSIANRFGLAIGTVARIRKKAGMKGRPGKKLKKRTARKPAGKRAPALTAAPGIYLIMDGKNLLHAADSEPTAKAFANGYKAGNPSAGSLKVLKASKTKEVKI